MQIVNLERKISIESQEKIRDGRIFTSKQAKKIKLIDEVGVEKNALDWLKKKAGLDDKIKIIDYAETNELFDFLNLKLFRKFNNMDLKLTDGILAIWTP